MSDNLGRKKAPKTVVNEVRKSLEEVLALSDDTVDEDVVNAMLTMSLFVVDGYDPDPSVVDTQKTPPQTVPSYIAISERVTAKAGNISNPKEIKQKARELRVKVRDNAKVIAYLETTGEGKGKRYTVKPGKEDDLEKLLVAEASSKPLKTEREEQPGKTPTEPAATQDDTPPVPSYTTISERVVAKERDISDPKVIKQRAKDFRAKVRDNAKVLAYLETTGKGKRKRHTVKPGKEKDLERLLMAEASSKPLIGRPRKKQQDITPTEPAASSKPVKKKLGRPQKEQQDITPTAATQESAASQRMPPPKQKILSRGQKKYETIGTILIENVPHLFDRMTPNQKVQKVNELIKELEADGRVSIRELIDGVGYYLLPWEHDKRKAILAYFGTSNNEPKQDKPAKREESVEAYATSTYFSQLGREKQLQEVDSFLEFLVDEEIIENRDDLVDADFERYIEDYFSFYQEQRREKRDRSVQKAPPKQRTSQPKRDPFANARHVQNYKGPLIDWNEILKHTGVPSKYLKQVEGIHLLGRLIIVDNRKGKMMRAGYDPQKVKEFVEAYKIN